MPDRPNVLFVMDDQHNARCLGAYGNDVVRTPALDSVAAEGTRFEQAYCQNPICLPSRMCYLTGRYAHSLGIYGNYGGVGDDTLSVAQQFRHNGYDTGAFGKNHIPVDWATHGFDTRQNCDFADAEMYPEENDYYRYLQRVGYAEDYDMGVGSRQFPHTVFRSEIPAEHSVEAWTADRTIRWLEERGDDPFFAWLTFQRPHPPYAPPPEYADMYEPGDIELPPRDPGEFDRKPAVWQNRAESDLYRRTDEDDLRQVIAYYYALISLIDDQIGRVTGYLDDEGILDDTIVVFASDHGDFAGEHGFVRKNVGISEAVHRVPMIWRYPDGVGAGLVNDDLVESVDVFPTLCELAGLPVPDPVQGQSLVPALTGGSTDRDAAFCETPSYRTVRTERYKLTHYVDSDEGELYHVAEDPWEHENLYDDPAYADVRLELQERLLDFYATTEEPTIPAGAGVPEGTPAHSVWSGTWWETGGDVPWTPLAHLGGPEGSERDG